MRSAKGYPTLGLTDDRQHRIDRICARGHGQFYRHFYGFARVPVALEGGGAAYRTRTCDPRITNAMLYQLS